MKKYLLVIFGDFTSKQICEEIALTITPLVDSPQLKFQHTKGCLIFHFASEVLHEEIHYYVEGSLSGITSAFILSEVNDKMSVFMPEDIKEHLFDLENASDDVSINIDMRKLKSNDYMEDDEDFVALLLNEVKKNITKPTLDQLLDKIKSKGIDSLTQFEKDTLEIYSKN